MKQMSSIKQYHQNIIELFPEKGKYKQDNNSKL